MNPTEQAAAERQAREYLAQQLGSTAPEALRLEAEFDESPLEGEGRTSIWSFVLALPGACAAGGPAVQRHYVAVGQTQPNYFPAWGLDADDAYSVHVGTRFMLEMGMQRVEPQLEPPGAREELHRFVQRYAGGARLERESLAALFRCDEAYFAVYRLTLAGQDVYCMGADCPPGFYSLTEHPPQVALRLHLGKLIRAEARRAAAAGG